MIIASAVKFHIDKTNEDVIMCGLRHCDIYMQLKQLGFKPGVGYKKVEDGFLTDRGKFLNRKQAYMHAIDSRQIVSNVICRELFYEDLW